MLDQLSVELDQYSLVLKEEVLLWKKHEENTLDILLNIPTNCLAKPLKQDQNYEILESLTHNTHGL